VFRFQYTIVTKAARKLAWEVFSDHRCWNSFANIYGEIRWREGRPWQAGSRLEIELVHPFRGVIEHVLTSCTPGHRVGWIDHAMGAAMAQWVHFEEHISGGTRVHTWGDLVHSGLVIAGKPAEQLITSFIETWYENYRAYCDQLASALPQAHRLEASPENS
jgi:hypothetical protein